MNNKSHYIPNSFPIKVPFPPPIEESELKPSFKKGKLPVRATNQFLLYRTAVIKTLREQGIQDINMRNISKMASDLWSAEPEFVQQEYKILANRAKGLHQRTAKYLTSYRLKDTVSQRPLAPMPQSTPVSVSPASPPEVNEINETADRPQLDGLNYNNSPDMINNNNHYHHIYPIYYNIPQYILTQPPIVQEGGAVNNLPIFSNNNVYEYNNYEYFG